MRSVLALAIGASLSLPVAAEVTVIKQLPWSNDAVAPSGGAGGGSPLIADWPGFASNFSLDDSDWYFISWSGEGLTYIPTNPYPENQAYDVDLSNNSISDVSSLSNLFNVEVLLDLSNNNLVDRRVAGHKPFALVEG
jgi:hypothetical protein